VKITCTIQAGTRPGDYDYVHVAVGGVSCGTLAVLHPMGAEVVRRLTCEGEAAAASALDRAADALGQIVDALADGRPAADVEVDALVAMLRTRDVATRMRGGR
jgi:hypothetical protein